MKENPTGIPEKLIWEIENALASVRDTNEDVAVDATLSPDGSFKISITSRNSTQMKYLVSESSNPIIVDL